MKPLIGITADNRDNTAASGKYESPLTYSRKAKPMDPARQAFELALLTELDKMAVAQQPLPGVLGVCLGFQLMALHCGGALHQHLPETLGDETARLHQDDALHRVSWETDALRDSPLRSLHGQHGFSRGTVVSWHKQAVRDTGRMTVLAHSPADTGSVIEAAYLPGRPFYVGIQWHAERNADPASDAINQGIYDLLVSAAREVATSRARTRSR